MVQDLCGVKKRNADKMIERWCEEHYIDRIGTGIYRKLCLELT
jgi:predicted transcriptional regulator of viral defense system